MKLDVDRLQYTKDFTRSLLTFKHHIVYDPIGKRQIHLNEPEPGLHLDFVGKLQTDPVVCEALSKGEINPELQDHDFKPEKEEMSRRSLRSTSP